MTNVCTPWTDWTRPRRLCGSALLLALAGLADARFTPLRADQPSAKLCLSATSTPEGVQCMDQALSDADRKLNAAYRKALSVIAQSTDRPQVQRAAWKQQLTAAQQAWIAFRDADCGDLVASEWNGGTGTSQAILACRYDKTVQRTDEILSRYPLQ